MKALTSLSVLLWLAAVAGGEETLSTFAWSERGDDLARAGILVRPGTPEAPFEQAVISSGGGSRTFTLLTLRDPGIRRSRYAIRGRVRYEGVQQRSYLEMWSQFPRGRFFSRTLDNRGPLGSLQGSSDWRPFVLPFFNEPGGAPPQELTVNLVLGGPGTVALGPLSLVQLADDEDPLAVQGAWWSDRAAGLVGGITGSVIGCLGGLIGLLAGSGKGRALVVTLLKAMVGFGVAGLLAGVVALLRSQPYAVFYPLLLEGALCGILPLFLLPVVRRRYEQSELRRMRALDAR